MKLSLNQRRIGCGVGLLAGFLLCKTMWQMFDDLDPCDNQILSEIKSPNGKLKAIVFERNCGATTDFSTQVSVLPSDAELQHSGNIFVADSNGNLAPRGEAGGPDIAVKWLSSNQLQITYDARDGTYNMQHQYDDVTISYIASK